MEAKKEKKGGKKLKFVIGIFAVIAIVGIVYFALSSNYESTDNAQLDADIIPIRSSISGYVEKIYFKDNEMVKKGDLLFTINDTEFRTKVAQAEAALENAIANLKAVQSTAKASNKNVDASILNSESSGLTSEASNAKFVKAQADYNRIKSMFDAKAATLSELEGSKAELDVAKAQYNATIKQYQTSAIQSSGIRSQADAQEAMVSLAQALVRQKEAELILAKTQLDYATVEAPSDGIISKRSVEVGQYITAGSPMCSEIDNTTLWISANFKETQIEKIKIGQHVDIKIDAYPSLKINGKVESFIGATGAKFSLLPPDNSSGNFVKIVQRVPIKISLDGLSKKEQKILFPGLSAFVKVNVKK